MGLLLADLNGVGGVCTLGVRRSSVHGDPFVKLASKSKWWPGVTSERSAGPTMAPSRIAGRLSLRGKFDGSIAPSRQIDGEDEPGTTASTHDHPMQSPARRVTPLDICA